MEETGAVDQRKPLLTIEQQIEHLKSKGVAFELCSEEDAAKYLSERTYFFKVAAYRSLFEKRVGGPRDGQYIDLDFGHLRALASLDRDLRYALLPLTLDVEHAARTKLVRIATEHDGEDGYALSRDYMAGLNHNERRRREGEINMCLWQAKSQQNGLLRLSTLADTPLTIFPPSRASGRHPCDGSPR